MLCALVASPSSSEVHELKESHACDSDYREMREVGGAGARVSEMIRRLCAPVNSESRRSKA